MATNIRIAVLIVSTFLVGTAFLTLRSFHYSDSLTFVDATICTDEGLVALQIPLVRLAHEQRATTNWMTYTRGEKIWNYGAGGKTPLRYWMSMADQIGFHGGMLAGFGYWKGDWQSDSRPGPFIVMFIPIWSAIALIVLFAASCLAWRIKFGLRSVLLFTTFVGGLLWLLTLRAPA